MKWHWSPFGPMLCRMRLRPSEGLRGSRDDLETYVYQWREVPEMAAHRACGRRFGGSAAQEWGGIPGRSYRLCLRMLGMGGSNSADISQVIRETLLRTELGA